MFSNGSLSGTNDITLELRSGDGTGGTLLGATTQSVGPGGSVISIDTSSFGVNVTPGSVYTFLFTSVSGAGDLAIRGILNQDTNPYAGGRSYHGAGYGDTPTWDLKFETQVVPIPAAAWLFGSGLLGLVGIARRKKAA